MGLFAENTSILAKYFRMKNQFQDATASFCHSE
jgi:hypothetical protein